MPKRLTLSLLFTTALVLATACGNNGDEGDGGGEPGPVEGSLFAFGFGYDTGDEIAKVRVDHFRKLYPDVKLEFSESGFEEQPFLSALASGEPPDVVNLPRSVIGTYIARGVLSPLDDCLAQEDVDMDNFYESAVDQVTVDGSAYALPEFFNTRVWIINNAAFEEAGLDPKTFDFSDWDAIADANEKLTKVEGGKLSRIGIDPKLPEFLPLWAKANGGSMISDDGMESQLADPAVAEALEYSASLHEAAGGRTPFLDYRDTWDFFGAENPYAADQLAAMPMEQWYLNVLAETSPDVDITVRPFLNKEGDPITLEDGNSWAIPESSENPDAACAFIRVMTEKDTWVAAAEARAEGRSKEGLPNTGVYSGNKEADEVIFGETVDLTDTPALDEAVQTVLDTQDHAFGLPPSPAAAAYTEAWTAAVNEVLEGGDPAAELESANHQSQEAIDAASR